MYATNFKSGENQILATKEALDNFLKDYNYFQDSDCIVVYEKNEILPTFSDIPGYEDYEVWKDDILRQVNKAKEVSGIAIDKIYEAIGYPNGVVLHYVGKIIDCTL